MSRFARSWVGLSAAAALLLSAHAAYALCAIPTASYLGGAYGVDAVTAGGCFVAVDQQGAAESTTASAASSLDSLSLSSTADLTTGILTAYAQTGVASAAMWDSFTFEGLPAGGETITATLSFPGALTGSSFGIASLEEGSQTEFNDHSELMASTGAFFNTATPPSSIPLSFEVANGSPIIVFAELLGEVDGVSGVADFGDPPMLTLTLPNGASVTTASGVFDNFVSATVPEPSTWAMMLIGFGGLNFAAYRARRSIASEVAGLVRIRTPTIGASPRS
jgi:hypothetical protein